MSPTTGRAALALTAASFGGAAFNYLFQVHAAAVLDAAAFGALSAWLAWVTLASVIATLVQFLSLDHRLDDVRFRSLVRGAGIASLVVFLGHLVLGGRLPQSVLGLLSIAGGVALCAVVGQLQARLELGTIALSVVVTSGVRFGLPCAYPRGAREPGFYLGHASATFAAVAVVALALRMMARGEQVSEERVATALPRVEHVRLVRPFLLAFATVLFPIVDVLIVASTHDRATTGAFSRISLAARVVFFFGAAALQVLLPHQLRASETGDPLPWYATQLERWLTPATVGGAAAFALLLDRLVIHPHGEEQTWLFASCLSSALLVSLLGEVNRFATRERLPSAAACVAGVVLTRAVAAGLAHLAEHASVSRYVLGALAGDAVVLAAASVARARSIAPSPKAGLR